MLSDKQQLGTKEAPASSDPVVTAALDVVRTMAPELQATPHSITGFAPDTLIAASKAAGTVVVGAHGRSAIPTVLLGSVSQQVAIHSSCPVVVVRESRTQGGVGSGHVVVGVDGSEASEPALGYAFAYAASTGRSLTAVHTWWWEPMEGLSLDEPWARDWTQIARQEEALVADSRSRGVAESLAGWSEKYADVPVRRYVVRGEPVAELLGQAHGASLLAVGSRGPGRFIGLVLGSGSRRILTRGTCSVAMVRSVGVDQPAT